MKNKTKFYIHKKSPVHEQDFFYRCNFKEAKTLLT